MEEREEKQERLLRDREETDGGREKGRVRIRTKKRRTQKEKDLLSVRDKGSETEAADY